MKKIVFILCFIFCQNLQAQTLPPKKLWDRTIGGEYPDELKTIIPCTDGGFLLGGYSNSNSSDFKSEDRKAVGGGDYWIIKVDALGNKQWDKTIGGDIEDVLKEMISTPDGGYLLGGKSGSKSGFDKSEDSRGHFDYWIVKIDSLGNILWDKTFGTDKNDELLSVMNTPDGGYLLGGYTEGNAGFDKSENCKGAYDYWIIKIDRDGNKVWDKSLGGTGLDLFGSMLVATDGDYLIGGTSHSDKIGGDKSQINKGVTDFWLIKIDQEGNKLWDKVIGAPYVDKLISMVHDKDGGYLLGGETWQREGSDNEGLDKTRANKGWIDYWVVKIDSLGNKIWDNNFGGRGSQFLYSLNVTSDGGYLLAGYSNANAGLDKTEDSHDIDNNPGTADLDYWILKIDSLGNKVWDKTFGGSGWDIPEDILELGDGGFILGGNSKSDAGFDKSENNLGDQIYWDYWIIRMGEEGIANQITGQIFLDNNLNCIQDEGENGLANWTIKAESETLKYTVTTDSLGNYTIYADSGTYTLNLIPPPSYQVHNICSKTNTISFEGLGQTISDINFAVNATPCAVLKVDVSSNRRLRCFQGQTFLDYRNEGITSAENARLEVQIPEFVIPLSSSLPWTSYDPSTRLMTFELGTLAAGQHGRISLTDSIACVAEAFDQSVCTEARIYPKNTCRQPDPNWSKADLQVKGECLILFDPISIFSIYNRGQGSMSQASKYRIYSDTTLLYEGNVQLQAGDSLLLEVPTQGKSMRLEVDQVTFHPENRQVSVSVEGCGTAQNQISTGLVNQFPQNDENFDFETDCQPILGSYDPNDKLASPEGFTENHYVKPGTRMEYTVRFQNTGTAEAFNVKVIDTLTANLDFASFEMMSASHDYKLDVRSTDAGQNVLTWSFPNINLPDSTSNEPESHGYIKFKINPKADLAEGTQVENFADIYFDFNDPIRTNTTLTTFQNYVFPSPATPVNPCGFVSKAQVGSPQSLCGENSTQLQAQTVSAGKGKWTLVQGSGNIQNPNAAQTQVTGLGTGENIFRWQVSTDLCPGNYQDLKVTVKPTPAKPSLSNPADSTLQSSVAGDSYRWYLNGNLLNHNQRSLKASELGDYRVEVIQNGCVSPISEKYNVSNCSFVSQAQVVANQSICETAATLQATAPIIGQGKWTLVQGSGSIQNPNAAQTQVTGLAVGQNTFRWQVSTYRCTDNYKDLSITVKPTPEKPHIENTEGNKLQSSVQGDNYRWYLNGDQIPGKNSRILEATQSGNYQVKVSKAGCFSELSEAFALEVTALEAELEQIYGLKLHPNPTESEVNLSFKRLPTELLTLTLRSLQGEIIWQQKIENRSNQAFEKSLDLEHLPKGIYLLEIELEKGSITKKVVKQ